MSKLHIIMYHYVRDLQNSRYPDIKGMDYQLFRHQIGFLKNNFHVISMEQAIEAWNSPHAKLPENAVLLTFDDGYIDNFTMVFPVLAEYGIQGSFFVPGKILAERKLLDVNKIHFVLASANTEDLIKDIFDYLDEYRRNMGGIPSNDELFKKYAVKARYDDEKIIFVKRILQTALSEEIRNDISSRLFNKYVGVSETVFAHELYMNTDQVRCMRSEGMFFGLHGYDHYWLGNLPEKVMEDDINTALEVLEEYIDYHNWVINYPYGSYNPHVLEYIKSRGCRLGLTTKVEVADNKKHNKYMLPRLDCNDFPPKSTNYLNIQ